MVWKGEREGGREEGKSCTCTSLPLGLPVMPSQGMPAEGDMAHLAARQLMK